MIRIKSYGLSMDESLYGMSDPDAGEPEDSDESTYEVLWDGLTTGEEAKKFIDYHERKYGARCCCVSIFLRKDRDSRR